MQTPQGFHAATLRSAHAAEPDASDDAGLVEAEGVAVVLVEGDRQNLKITDPADLLVAEALLSARARLAGGPRTLQTRGREHAHRQRLRHPPLLPGRARAPWCSVGS